MMSDSTRRNHSSIHTSNVITELSASWTIENVHLRLKPLPCSLKSPPIFSNDRTQKWYLEISHETQNRCLVVYNTYMMVECADVVYAEYMVSVVDDEGDKVLLWSSSSKEYTSASSRKRGVIESKAAYNLINNPTWVVDDKLTLYCEVKAITVTNEGSKVRFSLPDGSLPDVYPIRLSMLTSPKFTDVVLVFGERELKAHKAMLVAQSSVFEAMFHSDMRESSENRVDIDDLDYEVADQMLQFIYTDKAPKLELMADRLLKAADKYDLKRLKIFSEQALCGQLSVDNVVNMLALASRHNADLLASRANEIVANNIGKVMLTQDWHDMIESFSVSVQRNKD